MSLAARRFANVSSSSIRFHGPANLRRLNAHRTNLNSVNLIPIISRRNASTDYLPLILQPSFWRSLVPKPLRSQSDKDAVAPLPKRKEWNPATFFIIIFLLIGSQAIQMITLQRDYVQFSRETEAKLTLLRDVVKRVQAGEDVDVEGILGTGDKVKEREWEDVLRELEEEDKLIQSRRQKWRANKAAAAQAAAEKANSETANT